MLRANNVNIPRLTLLKLKKRHYILHMAFSAPSDFKISKMSIFLFLGLVALFFTACAHTPKTCQELDWYEIGRQDGSDIKGAKGRQNIAAICEDSDQSLSEALYHNGFDSSVAAYCTEKNGFELGKANEVLRENLCPPLLKDEFVVSYQRGLRFRQIQGEQITIQSQISKIENALSDRSIDLAKRGLMSGEKIQLLQTTQSLSKELEQITQSQAKN